MTPDQEYPLRIVGWYPSGAYLMTCPECGYMLVAHPKTRLYVTLNHGSLAHVGKHTLSALRREEANADEMGVWRRALEDIEL